MSKEKQFIADVVYFFEYAEKVLGPALESSKKGLVARGKLILAEREHEEQIAELARAMVLGRMRGTLNGLRFCVGSEMRANIEKVLAETDIAIS